MNTNTEIEVRNDEYYELLEMIASYRDEGKSPKTVEVYSRARKQFVCWCRQNGRGDLFDDLKEWATYVKLEKPKSANVYIAGIKKAIITEAERSLSVVQCDILIRNLENIRGLKKARGTAVVRESKIITASENERLIRECPIRLKPMLKFLWMTGCRISEACSILLEQIIIENDTAIIDVIGKGRKTRKIRIPIVELNSILDTHKGSRFLFETENGRMYNRNYITREIKRLGQRVLGRRLTAHMFRHSFATRMLVSTRKLKAVSEYLGHSSTSTTLDMYVHETLTDQELFLAD